MKYARILLILLVAVITTACTKLPPMTGVDDDVLSLREHYFSARPDGKFNENISRGEVARGMHVVEVLAAWGLPNMRWGVQHSPDHHWAYFVRDDATQTINGYELVFEDRLLVRWLIAKDVDAKQWPPRNETILPIESAGFTASGGALSGDNRRP